MRLFISINLPANLKDALSNRLSNFKKETLNDIRWVKEENWHITLKFLGEIEEERVEKIKEKITYVARNNRQQSIRFSRIAAFPSLENPRVIFIGLDDTTRTLTKLYRDIGAQFSEKPGSFTPHLTIGRVKERADKRKISGLLKEYQELDFSPFELKIEKISLMKSVLQRNGPIYEELYFINLMESSD